MNHPVTLITTRSFTQCPSYPTNPPSLFLTCPCHHREINLELLDQLQQYEAKESHARQTMAQIHQLTHIAGLTTRNGHGAAADL